MITRVSLRRFRCFEDERFELDSSVVLAGPNNAGKSTLLQAIMTWRLGLDRWLEERTGGSAEKRAGVPITRQELSSVPLREMNLLWHGRQVSGGGKGSAGRKIEVVLHGRGVEGDWEYGLEFEYANPQMAYVRPLGAKDAGVTAVPAQAIDLQIVHIPALAGIAREEPLHDRGYQDHLVGQGRAGEILRNLLLEISKREEDWEDLVEQVRRLFGIELTKPKYSPRDPFIVVEYKPRSGRPLDLTCAGSGVLQVLLILAFYFARPAIVLLMDEPDAHLHVILQKQVYDLLRRIAYDSQSQLIIATHSEVLLDSTSPDHVLAFIGEHPRPLTASWERNGLREAIKRLTTTDLVLVSEVGAVLYIEDESDERILREWARTLDHPVRRFLDQPYVHPLHGRSLREAKAHFFALKAANPGVVGACLLDGDNRDEPDDETTKAGLRVLRWRRYEIENYLVVPQAIVRFCQVGEPELFGPAYADAAREFLEEELPPAVLSDPLGDHQYVRVIKASESLLVPLFHRAGKSVAKSDLYLLAGQMSADEIHSEVCQKLDAIAEIAVSGNPSLPSDR